MRQTRGFRSIFQTVRFGGGRAGGFLFGDDSVQGISQQANNVPWAAISQLMNNGEYP